MFKLKLRKKGEPIVCFNLNNIKIFKTSIGTVLNCKSVLLRYDTM